MITIDPALFQDDAIAPETRAVNAAIEAFLSQAPTVMDIGAEAVRAKRREGEGALAMQAPHPMGRWVTASALGLDVPVRVFTPDGPLRGVYIHIHGGGGVLGGADQQDQTLAHLAEALGIGVASIEYRLAPEHPFPAGADDCEAATVWLIQQCKSLFGTQRIAIGGESAGAYLAAMTILRVRDRHDMMPFCAANLLYGQFDLSGTPSVRRWGARNLILNTDIIDWFAIQMFPIDEYPREALRTPEISPVYAKHHDLCPALFTLGTLDPLVDDTLLMATSWANAGNEAELAIYPGGIHAFDVLPKLPIADQAKARIREFLGRWFDR